MVDWSRKIVKGKVPKTVIDAVEVSVVKTLAERHRVLDKDIFKQDLTSLETETLSKVPTSWRALASAAYSKHDMPLIDEVYWAYWAKEQVKVGKSWYGQGVVTISIPECLLELKIENGLVNSIATDTSDHRLFSTTSNWYLTNFFSKVGSRIGLIDSVYGNPDHFYFGYNDNSGCYGLGLQNRFTVIFPEPLVSKEVKKHFMFSGTFQRKKGNRYFIYRFDDHDYNVEFFSPSVKSVDIDINKYIDRKRLQSCINDELVADFCFKMSVELRSSYMFKQQEVVDTIGFSRLYKVIYSNEDAFDLLRGGTNEYTFYDSLLKWKKLNPDFGFPDEEELRLLAKESDVPQLPLQALKMLNKLGASSISDSDYQDIIINFYNTPADKRMNYLLSVAPMLNESERANILVLSSRSKRIFESCLFLGRDTFKILLPVHNLITSGIESNAATSDILLNIKMNYAPDKPMSFIFSMIFSRIALTGISTHSVFVGNDMTISLYLSIVDQLWADGLMSFMQLNSMESSVLRAIDFDVDADTFTRFMMDCFDGLYLSGWMGDKNLTKSDVLSNKFPSELNMFKKKVSQLVVSDYPSSIFIEGRTAARKKFKTQLRVEKNPVAGVVLCDFTPLGETDLEELTDGLDFGDEVEEFLEFEEKGTTKPMAFLPLVSLNSNKLPV